MKKILKHTIHFIIFIVILISSSLYVEALEIGDVINTVLATDIVAYIENQPINSYNIDGNTAVVVEDLDKYGFDIEWNESLRMLTVERNIYKAVTGGNYDYYESTDKIGNSIMDVYHTDIRTFLNGCLCSSYNVGGKTIIFLDDLNTIYGEWYNWNSTDKTLSLLLDDFVHIKDLPKRPNNILFEVLKNDKKLITESGKVLYIDDFFNNEVTVDGNNYTHVKEYTIVDFDDDNNYEIVASIQYTPDPLYFFFVVLHYNGQDVYGYYYGVRQMNCIKKDGSFSGSSGADSHSYIRLSFENNQKNETIIAIKDGMSGIYELYGKRCSVNEVDQFLSEWNNREDVEWVKWNP